MSNNNSNWPSIHRAIAAFLIIAPTIVLSFGVEAGGHAGASFLILSFAWLILSSSLVFLESSIANAKRYRRPEKILIGTIPILFVFIYYNTRINATFYTLPLIGIFSIFVILGIINFIKTKPLTVQEAKNKKTSSIKTLNIVLKKITKPLYQIYLLISCAILFNINTFEAVILFIAGESLFIGEISILKSQVDKKTSRYLFFILASLPIIALTVYYIYTAVISANIYSIVAVIPLWILAIADIALNHKK